MCYDIKTSAEAQLKRAERSGNKKIIDEIKKILLPLTDLPLYHASGFSHPNLLIYTTQNPQLPEVATWGLIPNWISDEKASKKIWNMTLNAKSETLFDKPAFKYAAINQRCLVYVDGFFEYHHSNSKSYPFFIENKTKTPFALAGIWSEWIHKESGALIKSFSVVTKKANSFMAGIHNNPKLEQPRMPMIISDNEENEWLENVNTPHLMSEFIKKTESDSQLNLTAHTVRKLRGKHYVGNCEAVTEKFEYKRLQSDIHSKKETTQQSLF